MQQASQYMHPYHHGSETQDSYFDSLDRNWHQADLE